MKAIMYVRVEFVINTNRVKVAAVWPFIPYIHHRLYYDVAHLTATANVYLHEKQLFIILIVCHN